jgi:hypothetical protein
MNSTMLRVAQTSWAPPGPHPPPGHAEATTKITQLCYGWRKHPGRHPDATRHPDMRRQSHNEFNYAAGGTNTLGATRGLAARPTR